MTKKLSIAFICLIVTISMIFTYNNFKTAKAKMFLPSHPGTTVESNSLATIDYSNCDDGYVMVKYTGSSSKVKLQIIKNETYNYDLSTNGKWDSFPLTDGSGTYTIRVMENIVGNRYSVALNAVVNAQISDPVKPFLISHQRIDFSNSTKCVQQANKLCKGKSKDLDKVSAIYNWVVKYFSYDYNKARTVRPGYIPNLDEIYRIKKGICYDYASTTCAMLRSQGIPSKMIFGFAGKNNEYHAWISVYIRGEGWVNNIIHFKERKFTLMDPTFASGGATDPSKTRYIQKSIY